MTVVPGSLQGMPFLYRAPDVHERLGQALRRMLGTVFIFHTMSSKLFRVSPAQRFASLSNVNSIRCIQARNVLYVHTSEPTARKQKIPGPGVHYSKARISFPSCLFSNNGIM